ncbi:MAG: thioredoxin [Gemmataceae bacterium]|nr:thioredoxin [Gemmataceae bacterium]
MSFDRSYDKAEPTREEVDGWSSQSLLEFGADWCPICQGAQPIIEHSVADHPDVRHVKVGDGKGKPLGRSYKVKLWPTLIFLKDGLEVARVVRPSSEVELQEGFAALK